MFEDQPEFETPAKRARGRPSGARNKPKYPNLLTGKDGHEVHRKKKELEHGMGLRTRNAGKAGSNSDGMDLSPETSPPVPLRTNQVLTDEQSRMSLFILRAVMIENETVTKVSTSDPYHRAAAYTGVSHCTLRKLWAEYIAQQGTQVPASEPVKKHKERMTKAGSAWCGAIRAEIKRIHMVEGKAVEIPTLCLWMRTVHNITLSRSEMQYRLTKMGFLFGKVKKLTLRKECAEVVHKRERYILERHRYKKLIEKRDALIAEWDTVQRMGPHELEKRPKELLFVYLDESYVNRNHSLGFTWYHPDEDTASAVNQPAGKGERFIMLTGLTKHGMLENWDALVGCPKTMMLYQARKATGDYHANMDADMFCKWMEEMMLPALEERNMEAIFVMDNASYHCTPAPGSLNVRSMTTKAEVTDILDYYTPLGAPQLYRPGRAPHGDNLEQLKVILNEWLVDNADLHQLLVDKTRVGEMIAKQGHHLLYTPPYHPELQPIETLWRDVKMRIARKYSRQRTMATLKDDIIESFRRYGSAANCQRKIAQAEVFEASYAEHGLYGSNPIDLTGDDEDEAEGHVEDVDVGMESDGDVDGDDEY
jgi:hypothetical protein